MLVTVRRMREIHKETADEALEPLRVKLLELCEAFCCEVMEKYSDSFALTMVFRDYQEDKTKDPPTVLCSTMGKAAGKDLIDILKAAAAAIE
jgi:hypothetical protein